MKKIQKKICLLGDFSVGKTSLVRRFVYNKFEDDYHSTIGVNIARKTIELDEMTVKLLIWDLAGGDDYSNMTTGYLKGAAGIIHVCDITRRLSFDAFDIYTRQIKKAGLSPCQLLIGNKFDLLDEREISEEKMAHKSEELGVSFTYTSAKTGEGVEEAFRWLAKKMVDKTG